jgi:hypothetical protein
MICFPLYINSYLKLTMSWKILKLLGKLFSTINNIFQTTAALKRSCLPFTRITICQTLNKKRNIYLIKCCKSLSVNTLNTLTPDDFTCQGERLPLNGQWVNPLLAMRPTLVFTLSNARCIYCLMPDDFTRQW